MTWSNERESKQERGAVHKHACRNARDAVRCRTASALRGGTRLVVAVRADNGTLALLLPVRLHCRANGRARSNAAAAEAKRGGDGSGGLRSEFALLLAAARLLDWGLLHGCGADGTLAEQPMYLVGLYRK